MKSRGICPVKHVFNIFQLHKYRAKSRHPTAVQPSFCIALGHTSSCSFALRSTGVILLVLDSLVPHYTIPCKDTQKPVGCRYFDSPNLWQENWCICGLIYEVFALLIWKSLQTMGCDRVCFCCCMLLANGHGVWKGTELGVQSNR
jgi:hypothetical protein